MEDSIKVTVLWMVILTIYSGNAFATWFCKESASMLQENTFYACGHAIADTLSKARSEAFKSAKHEFESFCNESEMCKDNAYNIAPLRTDCEKSEAGFSCHRGLEYTILPHRKNAISIDKKDLNYQILKKEGELHQLEKSLEQVNRLEDLNERIEEVKKIDSKAAEIEYLKHATKDYSQIRGQAFGIKLSGIGSTLKEDDTDKAENVSLGGIGFEYKSEIWKNIGLQFNLYYVTGESESKLKDRGTANTTSKKEYYGHKGLDANVSIPFTFNYFTISPALGIQAISYKSLQYQYNNFGIGLNKLEDKYSYNSGYLGLGLRLGKSFFIELEPRRYFRDGKGSAAIHLGYSFTF
ncbi:MAG: hypothetical protein ACLGHN_10860 [Bacteriovoracia bacterium]